MALFKISKGNESNLPSTMTEGYAYFCPDTGRFFIDVKNSGGTLERKKISAEYADKLRYTDGDSTIEIDPAVLLTVDNYATTIGTATTSKSGLMSSADKTKLNGIATGANKTVVDSSLSSTSTNPVQNKVIKAALDGKETSGAAASALSEAKTYVDEVADGKADKTHTHDDRYYTETEVDTKLSGKSDTNHNHNSAYDTKGAAAAVQTNLDAVDDKLDDHIGDSDIHVTTSNKSNWNTAYTHSQATHARTDATKVADSTTNGNILINGTETNVYTHPNSGVTAGTYKSVTVNAQGHVTAGSNPTTLAGYGITDAESKGAASSALASAKTYTDNVASGKADATHNHDTAYDTKGAADTALASAKTYADNAANTVKNDLLNGAGTAYDTLKELGDLIDDNIDAIDALEAVAAGKADKTHTHAISEVTDLQTTLDGKAAKSHGTHVSYSTTAPVMDGTAAVGSASTVARSDHKHPTDTSRASKTEFDTHVADTTIHITSTERTNWNAAKTHAGTAHAPSNAQANQNAFSNIKVGSTTVAADTTTDTVEFVGSNITITPDATNDKVTFAVADGSTSAKGIVQLTDSTSSTSTTTAATPNSVKSAYDLANTAKTNAATAQTRADSAYTLAEGKVDSLSDLGITATATELNYVDGVTSNIQTQLNSKAGTSVATTSANGLMSSTDKSKLDGIAANATANTGTITEIKANGTSVATSGSANIPAASTSAYGVTKLSSSTSSTSTSLAATASAVKAAYDLANSKAGTSAATTSAAGLMSAADKAKLDGIAEGANNYTYTLPTASSTLGGVKTTSTVTSTSGLTACPIISGVPYYKNSTYSLSSFGVTATAAELNILDGVTATVAEINKLDGVTATTAELNYVDGVTSNIQTQLDGKSDTDHTHSGYATSGHSHNAATTSAAGFMSVADKKMVDSLTAVTTAGTGAAYTATVPGITALTAGVSFIMVMHTVSTSTAPTLNVNGLGAKTIRRRLSNLGTGQQAGYAANWLGSGLPFRVIYDGTYWIVEGQSKPAAVDIYGTVASATKATQDASGNVITDTYATKTYVTDAINTAITAALEASY